MSTQGPNGDQTYPIDSGASGDVAANVIVYMSSANAGNAAVAGANQTGVFGVTMEQTDTNGYANVRRQGVAQVTVGTGGVVAGNFVASDASGHAVAVTPHAAGGGTLTGIIGIAQNTVAAGNLADVLINPQNLYV